MSTESDVAVLFESAVTAWAKVPKVAIERTFDESTGEVVLSCPDCHNYIAKHFMNQPFSLNFPIFCCGRLLF